MAEAQTYPWSLGDTLSKLSVVLVDISEDGTEIPVLLTGQGRTVKFFMGTAAAIVNGNSANVTQEPTASFTVNASTDRVTCVGHGYKEGQQVQVSSSISLPGGLSANTRYYISDPSPNDFYLDSRPGGPPSDFRLDRPSGSIVDITSTGAGTHSIYAVGHVQYDFQAGDVDAAGTFPAWFKVESGSETNTYPIGEEFNYFNIVVLPVP